MADLVGAVLGAAVSESLKSVIQAKNRVKSFQPSIEQLNPILELVISKVEEIKGIDQINNRPEISKLLKKLIEGKVLVEKCASVKSWNYYSQLRYSKKLLELDNYLKRFFQMDVQADMWCEIKQIKQILVVVMTLFDPKSDLLRTEIVTSSISTMKVGAGATDGDPVQKGRQMTRGTLEVLLVDASNLKDTDFFGKMDPYVIIQFFNQKGQSSVARGEGKAPVWNEKFTFDVEYPVNIRDENCQYKLNLTIMDKDTFTADDFVGESTIYLTDILSLGAENGTSELRASSVVLRNKTYSGEIRVGISFTRKDGKAGDKANHFGGWKQHLRSAIGL